MTLLLSGEGHLGCRAVGDKQNGHGNGQPNIMLLQVVLGGLFASNMLCSIGG